MDTRHTHIHTHTHTHTQRPHSRTPFFSAVFSAILPVAAPWLTGPWLEISTRSAVTSGASPHYCRLLMASFTLGGLSAWTVHSHRVSGCYNLSILVIHQCHLRTQKAVSTPSLHDDVAHPKEEEPPTEEQSKKRASASQYTLSLRRTVPESWIGRNLCTPPVVTKPAVWILDYDVCA